MSDKSARAALAGPERRAYSTQFEVRGKAGGTVHLSAYASVYDHPYDMYDMFGPYSEVVRQGAGKKTLSESPAVQLLLNHGGMSMAYTRAGTLQLFEDSTGLGWEADVNTVRSDVRDMVTAVEDGNVDECSFAFRCMRQEWSPDYEQRDIIEYNINRGDVSVVNFGANPGTAGIDAALRAQDLDRMSPDAARALMKRLEERLAVIVVDGGEGDDDDDVACLSCGALNEADAKFCDQCGAAMPAAAGDAPMTSQLAQLSADLERLEVVKPRLVLA